MEVARSGLRGPAVIIVIIYHYYYYYYYYHYYYYYYCILTKIVNAIISSSIIILLFWDGVTFTTLYTRHGINRRSKMTAVMSTELRLGIGAGPVTVTHSFATCHATFRPLWVGRVASVDWAENRERFATFSLIKRRKMLQNNRNHRDKYDLNPTALSLQDMHLAIGSWENKFKQKYPNQIHWCELNSTLITENVHLTIITDIYFKYKNFTTNSFWPDILRYIKMLTGGLAKTFKCK